jgi:DNA-directed RNA polymerase subunit RPC12/RpoP
MNFQLNFKCLFHFPQLDEDEKYPKILCENCHLKFGSFLEFLQEILMNQMRLRKMFGESKPDLSFSQSFEEMDIDNISIKSEPQEYESAVFQCENVFVDNLSVVNDHNQDQTSEDIEDESYPTLIDEDMKLKEICKVEQEQSFEEIDNETKPSLTSKPDDKNENLFGDSLLCDVCGISFKDRYSLKIHNLEKHVDDSVFKCKYCSENCKSIGNLRYHILTKHKIGEYKCSECHEIFDTVIKLRNHLQKHQPLVQCPFCEKSFVKFKLSTHIKNVHEVDKQSCELCGKVCENKRKLQKHITRSHKSQT